MNTTLNVGIDIMKQIDRAANTEGISCSKMIVILIKKVMNDMGNPNCMGRLVQYQARRKPEEWHIFHIQWRPDDYEYFQDMKKLLKMSVSLLLAYAVKKYLGKTNTIDRCDNYLFINYTIVKEMIDNIICWKFIWGYTPAIEKFL